MKTKTENVKAVSKLNSCAFNIKHKYIEIPLPLYYKKTRCVSKPPSLIQ